MKSVNKVNHKVRATIVRTDPAISYEELVDKIGMEWERGRNNAIRAVNIEYVQTKWRIGRHIVEFEQHGHARAKYGTGLIDRLARDLTARHGRGFSRSKLIYARLFYIAFPKSATLSHLYFAAEMAAPGDNPPIGIVLGSVRDQVVVEYAMRGITNRVFVSRYQLYLPDKEQLRRELAYAIEAEEGRRGTRQNAKRKGGEK